MADITIGELVFTEVNATTWHNALEDITLVQNGPNSWTATIHFADPTGTDRTASEALSAACRDMLNLHIGPNRTEGVAPKRVRLKTAGFFSDGNPSRHR